MPDCRTCPDREACASPLITWDLANLGQAHRLFLRILRCRARRSADGPGGSARS